MPGPDGALTREELLAADVLDAYWPDHQLQFLGAAATARDVHGTTLLAATTLQLRWWRQVVRCAAATWGCTFDHARRLLLAAVREDLARGWTWTAPLVVTHSPQLGTPGTGGLGAPNSAQTEALESEHLTSSTVGP